MQIQCTISNFLGLVCLSKTEIESIHSLFCHITNCISIFFNIFFTLLSTRTAQAKSQLRIYVRLFAYVHFAQADCPHATKLLSITNPFTEHFEPDVCFCNFISIFYVSICFVNNHERIKLTYFDNILEDNIL